MLQNIEQIFLWFILYGVVGWIYESILCSVTGRKLVNRGFLNGPICPIYGSGAVAVILLLWPLREHFALLFLTSAVLTTSIEYFTSWLMEKLFHARWWDYSGRFMNIRGRVCLLGFVAFGAMSALVVRFVHPLVEKLTGALSATWTHALSGAFLAIMAFDTTITLWTVLDMKTRLAEAKRAFDQHAQEMRRALDERLSQSLGEKADALREKRPESMRGFELRLPELRGWRRAQMRRLSAAFPKLNYTRYGEQWQKFREKLHARHDD